MSKRWLGLLLLVAVWIGGARLAHATFALSPPVTLDIGNVQVGQSKTADETLISDMTTNNVSVTLATGGDCGLFSITAPTFPVTVGPLSPANDVKVSFKFTPITTGARMCLATVKQGSTTLATVTVKGSGTAPQISVVEPSNTPATLQYDHVDVGQMKTLQVKIQNDGDAPLTVSSATFPLGSDDYLMAGGPTGPIAALGGQATWDITCKPSGPNQRNGTFRIASDALSAATTDVALKCVGDQGLLVVGLPNLDFGRVFRGTTRTLTVTLTNTGNVAVTGITAPILPNDRAYSIDATTPVPTSLDVNSPPVTLKVNLAPQNRSHGGNATIGFSGTWGTSGTATPPALNLTGLEASFSLVQAPTGFDFGTFRFDAHPTNTFQIVNDGNAALMVQAPFTPDPGTAMGEYKAELVKSQAVVPPPVALAADEKVEVRVTPQVTSRIGVVAGHLDVTSPDVLGSPTVTLTLTGIATSALVKIPPTVEFNDVDVNGPSQRQIITIENTGDGMLDVVGLTTMGPGADAMPSPAFKFTLPTTPTQIPPGGKLEIPVDYSPTMATIESTDDTVFLKADLAGALAGGATVKVTGSAVFTEAHGSGGCSTTGSTGRGATGLLLGLAAFGAVGLRRRSRRRARAASAVGVAALAALVPAAAHADDKAGDDIGIAVFEPTPSTTGGGFALQSPDVGASGSWVMNAVTSYASNPLVIDSVTREGKRLRREVPIERSTLLQIGGAYALLGRFEIGAHLPIYQQSGTVTSSLRVANGTALGNLSIHAKAKLLQTGDDTAAGFVAGVAASAAVPTATSAQYTGSDRPEGQVLLLASFTPAALGARLALSVNGGAVLRGTARYSNIVEKSGARWGAGASIRIIDELWATGELFGAITPGGLEHQMAAGVTTSETLSQVEGLAGLTIRPDRRVSIGLAFGRGVTGAIGTPDMRGVLSLSVVPGAAAVAPIHPPEVIKPDGDADGDGIPDSLDKCPNEPEDKDMFQDDDGCPDPDNDRDGIPDELDKCPLDPEDKDGFQDDDGCPDKDNDGDGVPDTLDKCPNEPEDKDGFQDLDGCPELDNDGDGIPDDKDKCPNEPETINGIQDDDGCPDKGDSSIILSADRIETLDPIQFTGIKLAKTSNSLLGQVAATLRAHGEIVRVRITVHVQPTTNAEADQARSDKRAQAVRDWLVQWGIAPTRLDARGFGGTKPLVPAEQRGAAKINDRIELIILERK